MATQLREYRIREGSLEDFVGVWRRRILPIRESIGFTVPHAWTAGATSSFFWLLDHPGDIAAFEAADRRYHDSPERAALSPDPAELIEEQTTTWVSALEL